MSENTAHLVNVRLRLRKAVLGARRSDTIRKLDTCIEDGRTMWEISQPHWLWALGEARDALGLADVSLDYIRLPLRVEVSRAVNPYVRTYRPPGGGPRVDEMFESVRSGTVINVKVLVLGTVEDGSDTSGKRPPSPEELLDMLDIVGDSIGISPWGSKYGYGRFAVERNAAVQQKQTEKENGKGKTGQDPAGD